MIERIRRLWQAPPRIDRLPGLEEFLASHAAFVSQKCTIEYCRARSGLLWDKLFREQAFNDALEISRWEAFAAVLADLAVILEGRLRPHLPGREMALADRLAAMVASILAAHGVPAHRPQGWGDVVAETRDRLAAAQLAAPKPAGDVGLVAGARVYDTLPIHPSLRGHDRELVTNNIRFGLVGVAESMRDRLDLPALAAAIQ